MCTAISYKTKDHYFGRTLDYDVSYNESVTITPRNFPFPFRQMPTLKSHYAMIGMAVISDRYPLYYEATNEKGVSMAGLNFPDNAHYKPAAAGFDNITPFEFIPWILGQCSDIDEVKILLTRIRLTHIPFSDLYPLAPLHWIISDRNMSVTVESTQDGLTVYDNPVGVLTNNPAFDIQMFLLNSYMRLSIDDPVNTFSPELSLKAYSRGMGAMGLPGDLSSTSRFVRAVFTKMNSVSGISESESISQFFHILESAAQTKGCVRTWDNKYEYTLYTSCCNTDKGIYYYTTYENHQITAVNMHKENLDAKDLITYPLVKGQQVHWVKE